MNLIATGGYGDNGISNYAEIDWTKDQHDLTFRIANIHDLIFDIKAYDIKFNINTNSVIFNINTYNKNFNIETHDIKFITKKYI